MVYSLIQVFTSVSRSAGVPSSAYSHPTYDAEFSSKTIACPCAVVCDRAHVLITKEFGLGNCYLGHTQG